MNNLDFVLNYIKKTERLAEISLDVCRNLCMIPHSCCKTGICPDMQTYAAKLDIKTTLDNNGTLLYEEWWCTSCKLHPSVRYSCTLHVCGPTMNQLYTNDNKLFQEIILLQWEVQDAISVIELDQEMRELFKEKIKEIPK